MSADGGPTRSVTAGGATQETFELERFAWTSPDRLELAGRFAGLLDTPGDAPLLVVHGAARVHRLPAVELSTSGPPEDGQAWHATFAWEEPPEPFTAAELELGELMVALPDPAAKRPRFRRETIPVRRPTPITAARRVGLEAEVLSLREELRDLRVESERGREELARAQQALQDERERRTADAERFRAGLAQVQASAEQAVAEAAAERDELRASAAAVASARESAGEASADAERLLGRLQTLRDALGGPG